MAGLIPTVKIRTVGNIPSRWRCGVLHTPKVVEYLREVWTDEELAMLNADECLQVVFSADEQEESKSTVCPQDLTSSVSEICDRIDALSDEEFILLLDLVEEIELQRSISTVIVEPASDTKIDIDEPEIIRSEILATACLAIAKTGEPSEFTKSGVPKTGALAKYCNPPIAGITAAERDAAWNETLTYVSAKS